MKIRGKLLALLLAAAVTPAAVSGLWSLSISQEALQEAVLARQRELAVRLAADTEQLVRESFSTLIAASRYLPLGALKDPERAAALRLIYRQFDRFNVVGLVDESGRGVGPAVYAENPDASDELVGHEAVRAKDLERFAANVPLQAALASGRAIGSVYHDSAGRPRVALVLRVDGKKPRSPWGLAVELSLTSVQDGLGELVAPPGTAEIVGADLGVLIGGASAAAAGTARTELKELAAAGRPGAGAVTRGRQALVAGFAPMPTLGWGATVSHPQDHAYAAVTRMRRQIAFWVATSLVAALVLGVAFAQGLVAPIQGLAAAARALAEGTFSRAPVPRGKDEVVELARTFNRMGDEIARRDAEIRAWNKELQQRVDDKTKELAAAHDQLLQSQKLAAVAELGAGAAHEINNPLAVVSGLAQVVAQRAGDRADLRRYAETMQRECARIAGIVRQLHALSNPFDEKLSERVDLNDVVRRRLEELFDDLRGQEIEVDARLDPVLGLVRGDSGLLGQVLDELVHNAANAINGGGRIVVTTSKVGSGAVKLACADTGCGIADEVLPRIFEPFYTTKGKWSATGLGLSLAHRIVTDHGGAIKVDTKVGKGTTVTLTFPRLPEGTQLF